MAEAEKAKAATRLGGVSWRKVYIDAVGEQRVWDFRDLFLSAIAFFREGSTCRDFFGTYSTPEMVDAIVRDFGHTPSDETSTMAMLDLFSSWILQYPVHDTLRSLLYDHAKAFAESVERSDPELMMSGPFVRWLLAKTSVEITAPRRRRRDGVALEDFGGLKVDLGRHTHLPVYVPNQHSRKPSWDFFFRRSTPEQRHVLEVAASAAQHLGDYHLQAEALKLLILQSEDPRDLMDTLAHLQLEGQGDKEGYIATCLSRYLVITDPAEEAELLQRLEGCGDRPGTFDFENCHNASLVWAWSAIRIMLRCSSREGGSGTNDTNDDGRQNASFAAMFAEKGIRMDEWRLPFSIVNFSRQELGINVPPSKLASDRPLHSSPLVYGRHVAAQPGTKPQPAQTSSGNQNGGGVPQGPIADIPNFNASIPEGYVPYPNLASQSTMPPTRQEDTAYIPYTNLYANWPVPPPTENVPEGWPGGLSTGGPSVQTQHQQNSREGHRARRFPGEEEKEEDRIEAAPSKEEEKSRASQEKRKEAEATGNDDPGSFGEPQQRPKQGQEREVHWDETGFTEGQVGTRDEDGGTRQDNAGVHDEAGALTLHDRRNMPPPKETWEPWLPGSQDTPGDLADRYESAFDAAAQYVAQGRADKNRKKKRKEEKGMKKTREETDECDDEDQEEDEDEGEEADEEEDTEHENSPTIEEA